MSKDGKYIVSANEDNRIKVWDFNSAECIKTFKEDLISSWNNINSVEISSDGNYIISGGKDKKIKVWDINKVPTEEDENKPFTRKEEYSNILDGHSDSVSNLTISEDGKYIISGSVDKTIKIWDFKTSECLRTLEGHVDAISIVTISKDGKYIVSGSKDKTIKIWDFKTSECLRTLEGHFGSINSLVISPDNKHIVSASEDKKVKIWDFNSGKCLISFNGYLGNTCSLAISPDGKYIISGSNNETINIWELSSNKNIYTIDSNFELAIDEQGFFKGSIDNINQYIKICNKPLNQRNLTQEEIVSFSKKGNFLELN
ncbi:WD40 repeat domain-containing protein (plasmid) [Arcobacter cryaerophilus gv. pseudocryaerophilus]|uniref:WD40 repeat-containing protein SMU1 n=3 Tax=Arcobacteraceae TaxID=2808963 RepID=A0AA96DV43_9BACT|nr:WD40 repeat domain-containing protein [Arcobacter sp. AZ-2023]WNL37296.1 WD40 repeat domain-containing protein [Arcobacter sp. AZ-2023]WPD13012.1 WD40 repeat domain-containing protein [Arcobacter sp. DSM 115960]